MIIDCHAHITVAGHNRFLAALARKPFTVDILLKRMDMESIERSVLLPLANPENADCFGVAGNLECVKAARRHPDRLVPFVNIDPRSMLNTPQANLSAVIKTYRDMGCRGIGEVCANLPITDPRYKNLFHHAGECGMPVLFHLTGRRRGVYGVIDEFHLPGLETALREFPATIFIGHAMAFWSEIDGRLRPAERDGYPKGPITRHGTLWRLLDQYPNLYGDISAGSGYNAISRSPDCGFLQRFHKKLFFGTDRFTAADEPIPRQIPFLRESRRNGTITADAYDDIMGRNFDRVVLHG